MNLYEIDAAITALVDPETGEIVDFEQLESLSMARDTKIENVACWYKNLAAESLAIRSEEKKLAERRQSLERKADSLKKYLGNALNGEKISTAKCAVSFRRTTSVSINNTESVIAWAEKSGHGDCVKYHDPDVDKTALAKVLKSGETVPGAEIVSGLSVGVK